MRKLQIRKARVRLRQHQGDGDVTRELVVEVEADEPDDPSRHIHAGWIWVFSELHGDWGEAEALQLEALKRSLEEFGFELSS